MSIATAPKPKRKFTKPDWYIELGNYEKPVVYKSVWQIINTVVPYIAIWSMALWFERHNYPYIYTLGAGALAAGFLVRMFIIFHDCGHGSFFSSHTANRLVGIFMGLMVFTPYEDWRYPHAVHHSTTGDLDRREMGDIWTMTIDEFYASDKKTQFMYRAYRNPLALLTIGPPMLFLVSQRIPHKNSGPRERKSVHFTNACIAVMVVLMSLLVGPWTYLKIQLPMIWLASSLGVFMFYVQHQYEGVYWVRHEDWDPFTASIKGSSYFKLPKVLQWFTGNIGLHHIHHVRPRIPNYNLQACYDNIPDLHVARPLTLKNCGHCLFLNLYDEPNKRLVNFKEAKRCHDEQLALRN